MGSLIEKEYTKKDLARLRRKWYRILKKEGFCDIEVLAPNGQFYDLLRFPFKYDLNSPERKAQEKYFSLARSFYHECEFRNEFERKLWAHHSEGVPYRKIASMLRMRAGKVYQTLRRLRKEMIEYYFNEKE